MLNFFVVAHRNGSTFGPFATVAEANRHAAKLDYRTYIEVRQPAVPRRSTVKVLAAAAVLAISCATASPYAYNESESCPPSMNAEQHASGVVRCRAMCSSYARDFAEYDAECKCRCAPAAGSGGYRPQHSNEM